MNLHKTAPEAIHETTPWAHGKQVDPTYIGPRSVAEVALAGPAAEGLLDSLQALEQRLERGERCGRPGCVQPRGQSAQDSGGPAEPG